MVRGGRVETPAVVRGAESAQQLNARLICDGRQWSHWTGGGLFGCLNIEPRMARALLDGLRVRFSLGE